jgi:hypothetical protein
MIDDSGGKAIGSGDCHMTPVRQSPRGQILFRLAEGNFNYLEQMNQDGSGHSKVLDYPIIKVTGISPGRRWLMRTLRILKATGWCQWSWRFRSTVDLRGASAQVTAPRYRRRAGSSSLFRLKHRHLPHRGEASLFRLAQEKTCRSFLREASSHWQNRV